MFRARTPDENLVRTVDLDTGEPPAAGPPATGPWIGPPPRESETVRERRQWGNVQALYRRYNRAALVTVAAVSGLLLLLLVALPLLARASFGGHGKPAVRTSVRGAAPAPPRTVTLEAESPDNTLTGSAFVGRYPGASSGRVVRAIGRWGNRKGPGALRFNGVTVPRTGEYTVTFYFVNIQARATRTVIITPSTAAPVSVTVTDRSSCCPASQVRLKLGEGANSITFANPDGEAPAIDRIAISIP